jgi:hypothetical protein
MKVREGRRYSGKKAEKGNIRRESRKVRKIIIINTSSYSNISNNTNICNSKYTNCADVGYVRSCSTEAVSQSIFSALEEELMTKTLHRMISLLLAN